MNEFFADVVATLTTASGLAALGQVIMIDLVLAGDNAIVIGLAAGGLEPKQRTRAILIGIVAATVLRIAFAAFTVELLEIVGLLLAGGILLLWVCWKMWRDLRKPTHGAAAVTQEQPKTLLAAAWTIIVADVSMSLDNVLAVAGAARDHPAALLFGLGLSIVLMGVAANFIAGLLEKHRWIAYVGLIIILYVAGDMVYRGAIKVKPLLSQLGWLR
jgi:YjbE family integral membrane protein